MSAIIGVPPSSHRFTTSPYWLTPSKWGTSPPRNATDPVPGSLTVTQKSMGSGSGSGSVCPLLLYGGMLSSVLSQPAFSRSASRMMCPRRDGKHATIPSSYGRAWCTCCAACPQRFAGLVASITWLLLPAAEASCWHGRIIVSGSEGYVSPSARPSLTAPAPGGAVLTGGCRDGLDGRKRLEQNLHKGELSKESRCALP